MSIRFTTTGLALMSLLLVGATLIGCTRGPEDDATGTRPNNTEQITVVTTTGMIADLVRAIGGDSVRVRSLVGVGVDPHLYKPTRDDIAALLEAQIIFYNGHHLEGRMGEVLERAGKDRPVIAITESIPTEDLLYPDGLDEHPDPHLWLSPTLWGRCATPVVDELTKLKAADGALFKTNQARFLEQCATIERSGREAIATIPAESRLLITSHDAFSYFGRAFDIEVLAIQGISTESEAGLADLEALVALVVKRRIPAVFVESSVPRRSIEALVEGAAAQGQDVMIGGELFSDSMGPEGTPEGTWFGMIIHDIETVTRGLGGDVARISDVGAVLPR